MDGNVIKHSKLKKIVFLAYVFLTESIFWSLVISPFMSLLEPPGDRYLYNLIFGFFVFSVVFIWYKILLKLWVVFAVALIISYRQHNKINKEILIKSRKIGIIIFTIITVTGIPLEHQEAVKIVAGIILLPTAYAAHMYIPYMLTKKHLDKLYNKFLV